MEMEIISKKVIDTTRNRNDGVDPIQLPIAIYNNNNYISIGRVEFFFGWGTWPKDVQKWEVGISIIFSGILEA